MGSAKLTAHARLPLGNDRKAESRHKDAFIQQHVTHFDSGGRLTHDYGDDRRLTRQRFEPCLGDGAAEKPGIVAQLVDQLGMVLELPYRAERARRYRRWQGIGEELGT